MGQDRPRIQKGGKGKKKIQNKLLVNIPAYFSLWIVPLQKSPLSLALFFFQRRQHCSRKSDKGHAAARGSGTVKVRHCCVSSSRHKKKKGAGYQNERAEQRGQSPLGPHASQHARRRSAGRDCTACGPGSAGTGLSSWRKGKGLFVSPEGGNEVMNGEQRGRKGGRRRD